MTATAPTPLSTRSALAAHLAVSAVAADAREQVGLVGRVDHDLKAIARQ